MSSIEIIALVVTVICLVSFCLVFTILFRHYYLNSISDIKKGNSDIEILDELAYKNKENKKSSTKVKRIVSKTISYTVLALIAVCFGLSIYSRINDNSLIFGNSGFVVIASGSMSEKHPDNTYLTENNLNNQFNTYDIIGLEKYDNQAEIKLYDVIAFKGKDGNTYVHRIIKINEDGTYNTKGDANSGDDYNSLYDGYLKYKDIVGKYNDKRVPTLGIFIVFLQSNSGIITIVTIIYCMMMFDYYRGKYDEAFDERGELLLKVLNYNLDNEDASKVLMKKENGILIYEGEKYTFEDGKFIKKEEASEADLIPEEDKEEEKEEKTTLKEKFNEFIKKFKK